MLFDGTTWREPAALPHLQGPERFHGLDASVADFWRYALPDLRMNNARGYFAEFLVARALGVNAVRTEWGDVDVRYGDIDIEVKSAAHIQSWAQRAASRITFTGLRGRTWTPQGGYSDTAGYHADVYVFAWNTTLDPDAYDPLDVTAWRFHILPCHRLEPLGVKSISLTTLDRISTPVAYDRLRAAVTTAAGPQRHPTTPG